MKLKKYIWTIILVVTIVGLISIIYSGLSYINELEQQVDKRDRIIDELTFSDNLVKEYFNIETDTINNKTIYTLKEEKAQREYIRGNEVLSEQELLNIVNDQSNDYNELIIDYNKLINQYRSLCNDYDDVILRYNTDHKQFTTIKDSVRNLRIALDLIENNYGIKYLVEQDSIHYNIKILSSAKIDSALVLLPYFRENLQYDEKSGKWVITRRFVDKK